MKHQYYIPATWFLIIIIIIIPVPPNLRIVQLNKIQAVLMPQSSLWFNFLLPGQWTILVTAHLIDSTFILWLSLLLALAFDQNNSTVVEWFWGFILFLFLTKALSLGKVSEENIWRWAGPFIILQVPLLCPHEHLAHIQCPRASGSWEAHILAGKMPKSGNILTQDLEIEVKRNMVHLAFFWHAGGFISWPYIINMKKTICPWGSRAVNDSVLLMSLA